MNKPDSKVASGVQKSVRGDRLVIGVVALLFGAAALGFAVAPTMTNQAPEEPIADESVSNEAEQPADEGGITLSYKEFSVRFSANKEPEEDDDEKEVAELERGAPDPIVDHAGQQWPWLTLATVGCALVGLTLGPISWSREQQHILGGSAMALSLLALVWYYVVMAIVLAIVIVIVLAFLGSFAP